MIYILRARKQRKESRLTAAALEAILDTYEQRCRTLQEGTARIEAHLEKDQPDDRTH